MMASVGTMVITVGGVVELLLSGATSGVFWAGVVATNSAVCGILRSVFQGYAVDLAVRRFMMDWAFVGFLISVGAFLAAMLFATFYGWTRKNNRHESAGEAESKK